MLVGQKAACSCCSSLMSAARALSTGVAVSEWARRGQAETAPLDFVVLLSPQIYSSRAVETGGRRAGLQIVSAARLGGHGLVIACRWSLIQQY